MSLRPEVGVIPHYVFTFAQGDRFQADLLGGKGANLAEMTRLGLPVPPGFTITTEACRSYLREGHLPEGLADQIHDTLGRLEAQIHCWCQCARVDDSRCQG